MRRLRRLTTRNSNTTIAITRGFRVCFAIVVKTTQPQPTLPGKASHAPCTGCHAQQFANPASEICTICHTDAQSGKVKSFPPLRSFNVEIRSRETCSAALRVPLVIDETAVALVYRFPRD